jgi:acrylyl-CoA reductase (NADPH)
MSSFTAILATQVDGKFTAELEQLERSALPAGEVLIRVQYSSLNYKDGAVLKGMPGFIRKWPMVPGIDLSGVVEESSSPQYKHGDEVVVTGWGLSETQWGGYSELCRLDAKYLVPLPKGLTLKQAMGIGTAGFTAMQCVMALERHGLREIVKNEKTSEVLVTGAGGGVGSIAIAVLAKLGYRVTASTGRVKELGDYLRDLGAKDVIDRALLSAPAKGPLNSERWAGCADTVGGDVLAGVLRATAINGSVAACGIAGGGALATHVAPFILRGVNLLGINSVHVPYAERLEIWRRLAQDLPLNLLDDEMITEVPLESVFDLAEKILAGQVRGRTVVRVA